MAGVLLALFPLLLMFDTRAAFGCLLVAIVLLYRKRVDAARRIVRPRLDDQGWS